MANIPIKWLFNGVESLQNHLKTNPSFWMRILTQMLVPAWYEYLERCFFLSKPSSCIGVKKYEPMILVVFHRNPSVMVYHFIPTFRWVFHHPLQTLNNQGPFKQGTFLHNLFGLSEKLFGGGEWSSQHRFDFQTTNCDKIYRSTGEIHVVWWCLCNSRNSSDPLLGLGFSEASPTEKVL